MTDNEYQKIASFFLSGMIAVSIMSGSFVTAHAQEISPETQSAIVSETTEYTEYYEDGSSATIIVTEEANPITRASIYTKKGAESYIARNKNGTELWRFTVDGTFSVNSGVSSTCTGASYTNKITDTAWQKESASTKRSGNQAIGDAKFVRKVLFATLESKSCHVVLTCNSNGVLS